MGGEFRFEGQLRFEEYLDCQRKLAFRRRIWIRSVLLVYGVGVLIYGLVADGTEASSWLVGIGLAAILYAVAISPLQFRIRVRKNWNRYPAIREPFRTTVSGAGVETCDDRGNPVHSGWRNYIAWSETASNFLLYLSPLMPRILPKRLLSETEISEFREFLAGIFENGDKERE